MGGFYMLIDVKALANKIKSNVRKDVEENCSHTPKLAIIQVGDNPASNSYIKGKRKDCEEVGIICELYRFIESTTTDYLIHQIKSIQSSVDGVIVQLPLPKHILEKAVIDAIDPNKDVDGFTKSSEFKPCTAEGIVRLLTNNHENDYYLRGKDVLIINRSFIVGRPLVNLLLDLDATVTVAHSFTNNLQDKMRRADIIIVAVGIPNFVKAEDVKPGAFVVDVGINRVNGKLVGDVDPRCYEKAQCTPVPGGVGLLTRAILLSNVVEAVKH